MDLADPATVPSEEDTVTVTLSSGTQIEGTVEKVSDDGCTIIMTDSGVGLGDIATVTDRERKQYWHRNDLYPPAAAGNRNCRKYF